MRADKKKRILCMYNSFLILRFMVNSDTKSRAMTQSLQLALTWIDDTSLAHPKRHTIPKRSVPVITQSFPKQRVNPKHEDFLHNQYPASYVGVVVASVVGVRREHDKY